MYHNLKVEDCKIIALEEAMWKELFLDKALKMFVQQAGQNGN